MTPYNFSTMINVLLLLFSMDSSQTFLPLAFAKPMGPETDRMALLALKDMLTSGNEQLLASWNSSLHFCKWEGVSCSARHMRVSKLHFFGPSLGGSLAPEIGNLTFLKLLNITYTGVHGEIPKEVGRLKRLQILFLKQNNFHGEIPIEIANCSSLQFLYLSYNNLTGKLPSRLGLMPSLQRLALAVNNFIGSIPQSLGNLSSLRVLDLGTNNLQGSIPQTLGWITSLKSLFLGPNNLSGIIPSSLYNLSNIEIFQLVNNKRLSGTIPSNIDISFPNVQKFFVGNISLTGTIPPTLSNISQLQNIDLGLNYFQGPFPTTLGKLQNLVSLLVGDNVLGSGGDSDLDFLSTLTNCSRLVDLNLFGNGFGGALPKSIGNFTALNILYIGYNKISGSIPEEIGNLVGLISLAMGSNFLQGEIPVSIGKLKNLGRMDLEKNQLSGNIPTVLGNLTKLFTLILNTNDFVGSIPDSLKHCNHMQMLYLNDNNLSGNIPNDTFGQLQDLLILNMSHNSLIGSLPLDFGNLIHLVQLIINKNKLSGDIPVALGNCLGLSLLDINENFFQGSVPPSFGLLKNLAKLDISRNNLSGEIPNVLKNLPLLVALNLSFNHLHGEVPKGGVFDNITAISLAGNEDLCGGIPVLKLPACSNKPKKHFKTIIILISVVGCAFIIFVVFMISVYYWRRKPNGLSSASPSMQNGLFKVSYGELYDATNGFSSSNLVGSGSFGSVYKGTLHYYDKPIVVKVLNLQTRGASKSFINECKALSKVRHRNLLKILTCCSSVDYKGINFMAMVFEFMPNGSLEKWLLSTNADGESRNVHINFAQRLDIAIDIANALDYLHHDCELAIVHCDIKPSNVLLDDEMVAHLGDFGLAKLLNEVTGSSSRDQTPSSAIKGTIGYIAPEYGEGGSVTTQGDIYSYGILLLELLTGKKPTDSLFGEGLNLHKFCKLALSEGSIIEITDSSLFIASERSHMRMTEMPNRKLEVHESLISFAKIGVACSVDLPNERMGIKDVLVELLAIKKRLSSNGRDIYMHSNLPSYVNSGS